MEFAVPLYPEDLEVEQTGNKFCVKHVEDLESPDVDSGALLDAVGDTLAQTDIVCAAVLDNRVFDRLYSLIKYWTILQPPVQQRLVETLGSVVNDLLAEIRTPHTALLPALVAVANGNSAGAGSSVLASDKAKGPLSPWLTPAVAAAAAREQPRLAALLRNGYKALVFLFSIAVALAERGYSERAAAAAALSGGRGGRGGAAAPGKGKGKGKGGKAGAAKGKAGAKGRAKAAAVDDDDDAADDGNGAGAGAEGDNDKEGAEEAEVFDWPSLRGDCLEVLLRAIAVDPRAIWPASSPEEAFMASVLKTANRVLLSPSAAKDKASRPIAVMLYSLAVARCPAQAASAASSLVAGLMTHDHMPEVSAEVVSLWATGRADLGTGTSGSGSGSGSGGDGSSVCMCAAASGEVLRELGRVGASASSGEGAAAVSGPSGAPVRDTAGLRRAATFLTTASERLPALVLSNVSVLFPYLDCDAPTLRSALVTAAGSIIIRAFAAHVAVSKAKAAAAAAADGAGDVAVASVAPGTLELARLMTEGTRETLLQLLSDRCRDAAALTRAATLRTWTGLVAEGVIPMAWLQKVTNLAVERLGDKGALVRRAAGALLRSLMEHNPFGATLDRAAFTAQMEAAEMWLAAHAPHLLPGHVPEPAVPAAPPAAAAAAGKSTGKRSKVGGAGAVPGDDDEDDGEGGVAEASEEAAAAAAAAASAAAPAAPSPKEAEYLRVRSGCDAALAFTRALESAVPVFGRMLTSKTGSDVMEAIRFLAKARAFQLQGAEAALGTMLTLVWNSGSGVREEVLATFDRLYILNEALEEPPADEDADVLGHHEDGDGAAADGAGTGAGAEKAGAAPAAAAGSDVDSAAEDAVDTAKGKGRGGRAKPAPKPKAPAKANTKGKGKGKAKGKSKAGDSSDEQDEDGDDSDASASGGDDDHDDDDVISDDDAKGAGKKGGRTAKRGTAATAKPAAKPRGRKAAASSSADGAGATGSAAPAAVAGLSGSGKTHLAPLKPAEVAAREEAVDGPLVVSNLVALLRGASLSVRTSLEEALRELSARRMLPAAVVSACWEAVAAGVAAHKRMRLAAGAVATAVAGAVRGASAAASSASASAAASAAAGSDADASATAASAAASSAAAAEVGAERLRAAVAAYEPAIQRGRGAMAVLSMLAGAGAGAGAGAASAPGAGAGDTGSDTGSDAIDSAPALSRLLSLLAPAALPEVPRGPALLQLAAPLLLLHPATAADPSSSSSSTSASASASASASIALAAGAGSPADCLSAAMSAGDYRLAAHACAALARLRGDSLVPPRKLMQEGVSTAAAGAAAASTAAATAAVPAPAPASGKPPLPGRRGAAPKPSIAGGAGGHHDGPGLVTAAQQRHEALSRLVTAIAGMVAGEWDGAGALECAHWYAAAQAGIDAIFALAPFPDAVCRDICVRMAAALFGISTPASASVSGDAGAEADVAVAAAAAAASASPLSLHMPRLSRLAFVLGHVSLRTLAHLDSLALRVKTLRIAAAEKADRDREKDKGREREKEKDAAASASAASAGGGGKGKGGNKASAAAAAAAAAPAAGSLEDQLGAVAAEDEQEADLLACVLDRELAAASMLSAFTPLMAAVVRRLLLAPPPPSSLLQRAAAAAGPDAGPNGALPVPAAICSRSLALARSCLLALLKGMVVSVDTAEAHLPLAFTLLARCPVPIVRSTVATALGDVMFRFPNAVEPYSPHLYARLRDPDAGVRRNALLVLTHLALNGMVKLKGQAGGLAVCIVDESPRIADAARAFFVELSKRGGGTAIYNLLPDALTTLSALAGESAGASFSSSTTSGSGSSASSAAGAGAGAASVPAPSAGFAGGGSGPSLRPFSRSDLHTVLRFLLSFIDKDKQAEGLAERLLHRLQASDAVSDPTDAAVAAAGGVRRMWSDASFCLAQLPLSDKTVRRLAEALPSYRSALRDDDVFKCIAEVIAKARRALPAGAGAAKGKAGAAAGGDGDADGAGAGAAAPADGDGAAGDGAAAAKPAGSGLGGAGSSLAALTGAAKAEMREVVAAWEKAVAEVRAGVVDESAADERARRVAARAAALAAAEGLTDGIDAAAAELRRKAQESAAAAIAEAGGAGRGRGKGAGAGAGAGAGGRKAAAPKPAIRDGDDEDDAPAAPAPAARKPRAAATKAKAKARRAASDDDDDDGGEAQLSDSDHDGAAKAPAKRATGGKAASSGAGARKGGAAGVRRKGMAADSDSDE